MIPSTEMKSNRTVRRCDIHLTTATSPNIYNGMAAPGASSRSIRRPPTTSSRQHQLFSCCTVGPSRDVPVATSSSETTTNGGDMPIPMDTSWWRRKGWRRVQSIHRTGPYREVVMEGDAMDRPSPVATTRCTSPIIAIPVATAAVERAAAGRNVWTRTSTSLLI